MYASKCTSRSVCFYHAISIIVQMPYPGPHIAISINSPLINFGLAMILSSGVGDIGFLYVTKPQTTHSFLKMIYLGIPPSYIKESLN